MLHIRQAPYSLSLIAVVKLLGMLERDARGERTQGRSKLDHVDLGPEAALEAQLGRALTRDEVIRLRQQSGDMT